MRPADRTCAPAGRSSAGTTGFPMDVPRPLTPEQREILALFDRDLPEAAWAEIRDLLADYFARRVAAAADEAWDRNAWSEEDAERLLRSHDRRSTT